MTQPVIEECAVEIEPGERCGAPSVMTVKGTWADREVKAGVCEKHKVLIVGYRPGMYSIG